MAERSETLSLQGKLYRFFGINAQIIGTFFLIRLIVDANTRAIYPFIPQLSKGLGITVVGFGWLIFSRSIAGITGPFFGLLSDRYGRRKIMTAALLGLALGSLTLTISQQVWASLPMILLGISLAAFLPAGQAYISDQVSYEKRGRALSAIEVTWAITGIVTLPLIGWLIEQFGWRTPFLVLTFFSLVGAALTWFYLPAVERQTQAGLRWQAMWAVARRPNVLAAMGVGALLFVAIGMTFTVWSIWLSTDFTLEATALGLVATGLGVAELVGSGASSLFIDRLGKRRGCLLGLLLMALAYGLLPLTRGELWLAIAGLLLVSVFLEFSIVSLLSLYSEQVPEARATVFSLVALGGSIGLALGSPAATLLWENASLWGVCLVAGAAVLLAWSLTWRFLEAPS